MGRLLDSRNGVRERTWTPPSLHESLTEWEPRAPDMLGSWVIQDSYHSGCLLMRKRKDACWLD